MEVTQKALQNTLATIFPSLEKEDVDAFLSICRMRKMANKEPIVKVGQKTNLAFFILKGAIRGYHVNQEGVEKIIFLRPTHTFMGPPNALFKDAATKYTFEAIGETELLLFEFAKLEKLAFANQKILKIYLDSYKEIVQTMIYRIESMINKMPEDRYLDLMEKNPKFFQNFYLKDIANYLGITPVSLSRIIKRNLEK